MKREVRVVGIDDAPFDKFSQRNVLVVGAVFRGGTLLDGILSTKVRVDGTNSTKRLVAMLNNSKFKPQLQCILLDGIAVGGFNVMDVRKLNRETSLPVIVVMRRFPDFKKIKRALRTINKQGRLALMEKAGKIQKVGKIYIQLTGIDLEKAKDILKITCTRSHLPEPIRVAHIIASGIVEGESRGRA
jgi:endonuclease V-like protein UPF0215 family